jgi:hypothetical protein
MSWRTAVAAIGLGTVFGSAWMLWDQRQAGHLDTAAFGGHTFSETIPLMVQQDRGAMRLRWSPKVPAIRDAARGTLTITDGAHQSTLQLDGRELRAGLASYWPDGSHVAFRLETDSGASGFIEAPADGTQEKTVAEKPSDEEAPKSAAPARRRPKPAAHRKHARPIHDGLEWTEQ